MADTDTPDMPRVYPEGYRQHVVGMLWSTLAQMQTWFGAEAWKVYGIQVCLCFGCGLFFGLGGAGRGVGMRGLGLHFFVLLSVIGTAGVSDLLAREGFLSYTPLLVVGHHRTLRVVAVESYVIFCHILQHCFWLY